MQKSLLALLAFLSFLGCLPLADNQSTPTFDLQPPVLEKVLTTEATTICLQFNKEAFLSSQEIEFQPALSLKETRDGDKVLTIALSAAMQIGQEYSLKLTVQDKNGNTNTVLARFYGHNPSIPRLLLNEFTTQGSTTHPDLVELKILSDGNMGGLTFYHGTKTSFAYRFIFPAFDVKAGDFILIHVKPQNIPAEVDETTAKTISGGLDASPTAFDFWVRDGSGLSGNNGIIAVYTQPEGEIIDAVIYSNRSSDSDSNYRGFGSKNFMEQADELVASGGWQPALSLIRPEDAINPDPSTATRSICRASSGVDTDTKSDFHIVPTKKSSFGAENCDEVYEP